jgi:hypothetical protein
MRGGSTLQGEQALERAAQAAEHHATPRLRPDQAWLVREIQSAPTPWQPVRPGATPPTLMSPTTRGIVVTRYLIRDWELYDGDMRMASEQTGEPKFFGSAAERRRWLADGAHPEVEQANAAASSGGGFAPGVRTYGQVLAFPTSSAGVLRLLGNVIGPHESPLYDVAELLSAVPLRGAARAAVFRAIAELPDVRYLGQVRDPLGRPGFAIVADQPRLRTPSEQLELIFDPRTSDLLAELTIPLHPRHLAGVTAATMVDWTAYLSTAVVPRSAVPTLRQLKLGASPRRVSAPGRGQTLFCQQNPSAC